jgi:hypothetical protein
MNRYIYLNPTIIVGLLISGIGLFTLCMRYNVPYDLLRVILGITGIIVIYQGGEYLTEEIFNVDFFDDDPKDGPKVPFALAWFVLKWSHRRKLHGKTNLSGRISFWELE